jgi:hypothetical protein
MRNRREVRRLRVAPAQPAREIAKNPSGRAVSFGARKGGNVDANDAQRNLTAVAGLGAAIAADQIVDPHLGMIGHVAMLVAGGVPTILLIQRYFRTRNLKRNPPSSSRAT